MFADLFSESVGGRTVLHAMPLLLGVLCVLAVAYRYYSAFLAAKVAALDDSRVTPAYGFRDGHNYDPTNKWVLFGHHFAAISGAGPLIGPVLAIQYGYMPGLLWLVIGVCLAGAVQDMLVLAASVRRDGKSLAEIARFELGSFAGLVVSLAILFIVVIALAGLGFVVVKALGGEEVRLREGMEIELPSDQDLHYEYTGYKTTSYWRFPPDSQIRYGTTSDWTVRSDQFAVRIPADVLEWHPNGTSGTGRTYTVPANSVQIIPGSSWGTFTIAATIPIALLVGLYMYRIRPGRVVEASLIGATLTIAAVIAGNWIPGSAWERFFSFTKGQTTFALCAYGFVASVLPVWLLLCPRDYLSSILKIGTIALARRQRLRRQPDIALPDRQSRFPRRRADVCRRDLPIRVHLHHVRRHLRIPFPGGERHHAEDDRKGKPGADDRLRGDADRRVGRHRGPDRGRVHAIRSSTTRSTSARTRRRWRSGSRESTKWSPNSATRT